jgi:hypothetical protein
MRTPGYSAAPVGSIVVPGQENKGPIEGLTTISPMPEVQGPTLIFSEGENEGTKLVADSKIVLESAQTPYKGSTVIGHALSKHVGRNPEIWGKITGAMSTWNEQAMSHLHEIIRAPGGFKQTTTEEGILFLEKRLSDGRGVRLNINGTFKGFID